MRLFHVQPRIAPAAGRDACALAELYGGIWEAFRGRLDERLVLDQSPGPEEVAAWLRGGFDVYLARLEGDLVGAVRCAFPTGTCFLDRIGVKEPACGRGVGRALLDHAVERARRAGVAKVWLNLSPKLTDAVTLFAGAGFTEAGHVRASYWGEDVVLMERQV